MKHEGTNNTNNNNKNSNRKRERERERTLTFASVATSGETVLPFVEVARPCFGGEDVEARFVLAAQACTSQAHNDAQRHSSLYTATELPSVFFLSLLLLLSSFS